MKKIFMFLVFVMLGISTIVTADGDSNVTYTYTEYQITMYRDLPAIVPQGGNFTVYLTIVDINESNLPTGAVINEYLPVGWSASCSGISCLINGSSIKFFMDSYNLYEGSTTEYQVTIPNNVTGSEIFSGTILTKSKITNNTYVLANISGDTSILIGGHAITSNRILPDKASAGSRINVSISIDVNESNKPSAVIVKDFFPAGWNIISSAPTANGINSTNREIKWIFTGEQVFDRVVSYIVEIPSNELGNRTFSGEMIYNDPNDNPITVITEGDSIINVEKQCIVKGDFNCDDKVSDFEILDYVSKWVKGEVSDFDLLDAINNWAKG